MTPEQIFKIIENAPLKDGTKEDYKKRMTWLLVDFGVELNNAEATIKKIEEERPEPGGRLVLYTAIQSAYSHSGKGSEFQEYIGAANHAAYDKAMKAENEKKKRAVEDKTENGSVTAMADIKAGLEEIKNLKGEDSNIYLTCLLQVSVVGLRNNLGGTEVITKDTKRVDKLEKWYNKDSGKLYIAKFKTGDKFQPYLVHFKPGDPVRQAIDKRLARKKKEAIKRNPLKPAIDPYLISRSSEYVRKTVREAFKAVGLPGVNISEIRHSSESELIDQNPTSLPHLNKVAEMFKHSKDTSGTYYRPSKASTSTKTDD